MTAIVTLLSSYGPKFQVLAGMVVIGIALVLTIQHRPYADQRKNILEECSLMTSFLSYGIAMFFRV